MTPHRTREAHMRLTTDTMLVVLKEGGRVTARTPILQGKIKKIIKMLRDFWQITSHIYRRDLADQLTPERYHSF